MKRRIRNTDQKPNGAIKAPDFKILLSYGKHLLDVTVAFLYEKTNEIKRARFIKERLNQVISTASRILPALSVVLILATLVIYLTLGPGSPESMMQQTSDTTETFETKTVQQPIFSDFTEPDMADYLEMNRGGHWDYWYQEETPSTSTKADEVTATLAVTPEPTAEPTVTPSPTPSPTPLPTVTPILPETDSDGVVQEPRSISDFTPDDTRIYVKSFEANVRISPRTDVDILQTMTMGDRLTRTGIGDYWSQVLTENGKTGYIYNSLISTEVVYKPKPTATPTPKPTATPVATPVATATPKPTATPTATPKPTEAPADTSSGLTAAQKQEIVDMATSFIGVKYVYGGSSPSGFDCSGLTSYIYKTLFNITLPRSAKDQAFAGVKVSSSNIEIGDIICFDWSSPYGVCDHVGIYIGGGQYVHASYTAGKVKLSTVDFSRNPILSIRRIIP